MKTPNQLSKIPKNTHVILNTQSIFKSSQSVYKNSQSSFEIPTQSSIQGRLLARLHEVHRAIVVTSVVHVYVYVYMCVLVTLSVKVFYKSISLDHVDGSS